MIVTGYAIASVWFHIVLGYRGSGRLGGNPPTTGEGTQQTQVYTPPRRLPRGQRIPEV